MQIKYPRRNISFLMGPHCWDTLASLGRPVQRAGRRAGTAAWQCHQGWGWTTLPGGSRGAEPCSGSCCSPGTYSCVGCGWITSHGWMASRGWMASHGQMPSHSPLVPSGHCWEHPSDTTARQCHGGWRCVTPCQLLELGLARGCAAQVHLCLLNTRGC